jgi:hypothetical protein
MSLFSWLSGGGKHMRTTTEKVANITNAPGTYDVDVVGESHYQDALEAICGGRTEHGHRHEAEAYLAPEDDNPHDAKAVRVQIQNRVVGYLDRETARSFRKQMKNIGMIGVVAKCNAIIVGGWDRGAGDRGHFGVKLDLPTM